jgi:hypothetical protein
MLAFAIEGLICIVMAAPLTFFLAWVGHLIGWKLISKRTADLPVSILSFFILSVPAIMSFEHAGTKEEVAHPVVTLIEINASPEDVWKNVVVFPELPEPTEMIFRAGIAYPINARIDGQGIGAVRYCNFSTGAFVEPITVWDEPRLLAFDVDEQPETMKELSPYDLHPDHLHGYFISKRGQFKLTRLPNGHTLLEGTTWYYNKMQPSLYWDAWGDYLIHTIHKRVLDHIKSVSENNR